MTLLVDFMALAIVAFCAAALSRFIDFSMERGNILYFWTRFIVWIGQAEYNEDGYLVSCNWLFKPLGGCLTCFNFWVGVGPFIWITSMMEHNMFSMFILFWCYQSLSSFFLFWQNKNTEQ